MLRLIITVVVALALAAPAFARPHPRPREDGVSRAMAKEKRAEISDGIRGAIGSLHSLAKKAPHTKGHAKPVDPEVLEKAREQAEREANAVESSKKAAVSLNKELEQKRIQKEKLQKDMKQMHQALTATTTTAAPVDTHILDIPDAPENNTKVVVPPTAAQLAKMNEEKMESEAKDQAAAEAMNKQGAAKEKKEAEANKIKAHEHSLHSEADSLKRAAAEKETDSVVGAVNMDEAAASKLLKAVDLPKFNNAAVVAKAVDKIINPEKPKIVESKMAQQAEEDSKRILQTKTPTRSKAAIAKSKAEVEGEAASIFNSLHKESMEAKNKQVEADLKEQQKSVEEAKKFSQNAMKETLKEAQKQEQETLKPMAPHKMFRPKKFNPKSPDAVAKRSIEDVGRSEGALQNKMEDMMGSMERVRQQIGH